jgi:UDP-N-acetylglucosamine 2-epimerase
LLPRLGSEIYLPHRSDLWRTVGAILGGVRYNVARKGGAGGKFLCVNGPHYAESFAQAGVPAEKIVVTGSPHHDRLVEASRTFRESDALEFRSRLNISRRSHIVSFFLQPYGSMSRDGKNYADEVAWITNELLNVSPDLFVVVKVHPKENAEKYLFLTNIPRVFLVDAERYTGNDLNTDLILSSRLVVLYSSTIGYSALALEVPLLTYRFDNLPVGKHYQIIGGNVHVTQREAFAPAAKALLFDDQRRHDLILEQRRVRGRYMMLDGHCCDRIGAVLSNGKIFS